MANEVRHIIGMENDMNKIIIIGSTNNYNELGLVRSFGVNGIYPYGIIICKEKHWRKDWLHKSKYWSQTIRVDSVEEGLRRCVEQFGNESAKPVIITSMDVVMQKLDENYCYYSQFFILSSMNEEDGGILRYVNKLEQTLLAKKMGFKMLPTVVVSTEEIGIERITAAGIGFPLLLKPVQGGEGSKDDISVAQNKGEYQVIIDRLKTRKYKRVLVQPYMKERKEYLVVGALSPRNCLKSFTILTAIRQWPPVYGVGSLSKYVIEKTINAYVDRLFDALITQGYSGVIDVELFEDLDGNLFVNEFNWRSSGRNWVCLDNKVYSSVLWYLNEIGASIRNMKYINDQNGFAMYEANDINYVIHKTLTFSAWLKDYLRCSSKSVWQWRDLKPSIAVYGWKIKQILRNG